MLRDAETMLAVGLALVAGVMICGMMILLYPVG